MKSDIGDFDQSSRSGGSSIEKKICFICELNALTDKVGPLRFGWNEPVSVHSKKEELSRIYSDIQAIHRIQQ